MIRRAMLGAVATVLLMAAPAGAAGYLHVGEAKLLTSKMAFGLAHREHAKGWKVDGCVRLSGTAVKCTITVVGVPSPVPEVCVWHATTRLVGNGLAAKTGRGECVAA